MGTEQRIGFADYCLIAAATLQAPAEQINRIANMALAESALAAPFAGFGSEDVYPDPAQRAAILCSRLVRNHPLPDGNKRVREVAEDAFAGLGPTPRLLAPTKSAGIEPGG